MIPDYTYGGQWFDDMGYSVFALPDSPALGVDINMTPGLSRGDIQSVTALMKGAGLDPYSGE